MSTYPLQVCLITGSLPPDVCGVGDYTYNLARELSNYDCFQISLNYRKRWSLFQLVLDVFATFNKRTLVHLQYPTEGFGYSIFPLLFIAATGCTRVVTLHEFSSKSFLGKVFIFLLCLASNHVIVSSETEKRSLSILLSRFNVHRSFRIFAIPSNIPRHPNMVDFTDRSIDIAYFGQIRPSKGLEQFLQFSSIIPQDANRKILIIGSIPEGYHNYADHLLGHGKLGISSQICLRLSEPPEIVAELLSSVKCLYLPFPDGFSTRRGTLVAGALNGCQIITTYPRSDEFVSFLDAVHFARDPSEAFSIFCGLLDGSIQQKDPALLIADRSFSYCAQRHCQLYLSLTK